MKSMKNLILIASILVSTAPTAKADGLKLYPMGEEREAALVTPVHRKQTTKAPKSTKKIMARAKSTQGKQVLEFQENEVRQPQEKVNSEPLPEDLEQAMREHARRPPSTGFFVLDEESKMTSK